MIIDNSAWKVDDKEWLKARKEEWRQIQKNLKCMKVKLRGSYLKHHKELFFNGCIDQELLKYYGGDTFGHALPLFLMWYHPDKSSQCYQNIFDSCLESGILKKSRDLLFGFDSGDFTSEYGMMGGREELMVKVLVPSTNPEEELVFGEWSKYPLCLHPNILAHNCLNGIYPPLFGWKKNPYSPGQYLWEHLCVNIQNVTETHYLKRLSGCIKKILTFEFDDADKVSVSYLLAKKLGDQYNRREMPEAMLAFWDKTKFELEKD